jgi:hypothetical protein
MAASFATTATTPDGLVAGNADLLVHERITLISGQNCLRGTVLGKITASGKYNKSLSAAVDGSQTPVAVLAEDCDASAGDKVTVAYFRGDFRGDKLILGSAHTLDSIKAGLRTANIEIINVQGGA